MREMGDKMYRPSIADRQKDCKVCMHCMYEVWQQVRF
jgi:hypothetical protein